MLHFEKGNLVTGDYSVIVHQVNCKGVMGAESDYCESGVIGCLMKRKLYGF